MTPATKLPVTMPPVKFLIINATWLPVHFGWLAAGAALSQLDHSSRARRALNLIMALTMLAAVGLALRIA